MFLIVGSLMGTNLECPQNSYRCCIFHGGCYRHFDGLAGRCIGRPLRLQGRNLEITIHHTRANPMSDIVDQPWVVGSHEDRLTSPSKGCCELE